MIFQSNLGGNFEVFTWVRMSLNNSNNFLEEYVTMSREKNTRGYMKLHPEEKLEELQRPLQRQGMRRNSDTNTAPSSSKPKHKNGSKP